MKSIRSNQQGIVAIFSVLVIMGILTLLTVGFSTLTRQAQRRTLDDHLSQQAYYGAESGVNIIASLVGSGTSINPITDCDGIEESYNKSMVIAGTEGVELTCLLVNPTPINLEYDVPVIGSREEPVAGSLEPANSTDQISNIDIQWDSKDGFELPSFATYPNLPSNSDWGNRVGVVRVDLVQGNSPANRGSQIGSSYSFLLYPGDGTGGSASPSNIGLVDQGGIYKGNCTSSPSDSYRCRINITVQSSSVYKIRLTSYYTASRVNVIARSGTTALPLKNAQIEVDSTAKAADVYRRINVRLPVGENAVGLHEPFSVFGGQAICKAYEGAPGYLGNASNEDACNY